MPITEEHVVTGVPICPSHVIEHKSHAIYSSVLSCTANAYVLFYRRRNLSATGGENGSLHIP